MKNIYWIKQVMLIILIIIVIGTIFLSIKTRKVISPVEDTTNTEPEEVQTYNLCYYRSNKKDRGYYDISWLKINTTGSNNNEVTGEFQNLPAEKDSKVGTFKGTVGPVNKESMSRIADVWWDSFAEGMNVTEELMISFGDGSASVSFGGEQKNRGDGVYIYTDKSKITYQLPMSQIDCEYLNEKLFVEKYIKDNIKAIATNKPILGGSWYVTSISINPSAHTGEVTYEDGHIESKANIIYNYQKTTNKVEITKFELVKN